MRLVIRPCIVVSVLLFPIYSQELPKISSQSSGSAQPAVVITPRTHKRAPDTTESITDRRSDIRVDSTLVLIPVSVTDIASTFIGGLDKMNFKLYEDKVEQEVSHFSSEDAPLSVGIVFDTSGSMGAKLQRSREAVAQFMKTANPQDEFFLVEFSDRPELVQGFTTQTEEIQNRLTFTQARGSTAMLDGVYMAMNVMKKARNPRKAIFIISDGGDNASRYSETEVKNAVREADVQIYAIGVFEAGAARGRTQEELNGARMLAGISEQTGGRYFVVDNLAELPRVAATIGAALRNLYVLGYRPQNATRDGKYRRVFVKLVETKSLPPLRALFRMGYYAPTQ